MEWRRDPVSYPQSSPDLSRLDLFLSGELKAVLYETSIKYSQGLVSRLSATAGDVRYMSVVFFRKFANPFAAAVLHV